MEQEWLQHNSDYESGSIIMTTLLGGRAGYLSDEERIVKDRDYDQGRIIAWEIWFSAYTNGQLSFERLLRYAQRSLIKLEIDDYRRWKTLGQLVEKAIKVAPPKRPRGNKGQPSELRLIASRLVEIAHRDGYILNRASNGRTAFEHVAEILANLGIPVTPRQIEDWHYE